MHSPTTRLRAALLAATLALSTVAATRAAAGDPVASSVQASTASAASASLAVSAGAAALPVLALYAGSTLTIASIQVIGAGATLVLKGAADGARAVIEVSAETLRALGCTVGQSVTVVRQASGYLLVASGKALAYVPATADAALLHSARSGG